METRISITQIDNDNILESQIEESKFFQIKEKCIQIVQNSIERNEYCDELYLLKKLGGNILIKSQFIQCHMRLKLY